MFAVNYFVFLVFALEAVATTGACSNECICKWKNGKQSADCAEKDLTFLPTGLDSGTQILDFSGNNLQVLQKEAFQKIGLVNLQKIYIQHCRLHKIDNHAFKGLTNLVELDVSQNYLTVVPAPNFIYFPSLMRLLLSENPITSIKSRTFQHLLYLTTLEISNCKIEVIENEAFSGLSHLEWLKLDGNKITTIQGDSILPETLRGVNLHNNDWNCDCQLQDLHTWLRNFNIPHSIEPMCSRPPRLAGRSIRSIQEVDLACQPEITPTRLYLEINEGKNLTLECKVTSIPEAKISWWFQGQILQNDSVVAPGFRLIYFVEEGSIDKKSELFVYGTNSEDNGTYSCLAENSAGQAISNYTIRIIVKEEPIVIVVTFPYKYFIVLISGGLIIGVLVLTIIIVAIVSCKADSKTRKKRESGKEVALRNQNGSTKNNRSSTETVNDLTLKSNGSIIINTQAHHMSHYPMTIPREFIVNVSDSNTFSPNSLRNYAEKNPDLIHNTESVDKKRDATCDSFAGFEASNPMADTFDGKLLSLSSNMPRQVKWKDQQISQETVASLPRGINKNTTYQHLADVHLNPGCFLEADGYPTDFGLPKITCPSGPMIMPTTAIPFYQTLPHNRNKIHRIPQQYTKDNEFNSVPCSNYEHYNPADARYTIDGYPLTRARPPVTFVENNGVLYQDQNYVPSPPEGYKSDTGSVCCGVPPANGSSCNATWVMDSGQCTNLDIQARPTSVSEVGITASCYHIQTRCVNTQTSEADARPACIRSDGGSVKDIVGTGKTPALTPLVNARTDPEVCTESPDEGYVGDGGIDPAEM